MMAKRFSQSKKVSLPWLTALLFLFFFQGAVYYHLMVCVVLVLLGYKKDKPLRTLIFVLLASVWAGISRVNWMPVPGLLAVALYLLDTPFDAVDAFEHGLASRSVLRLAPIVTDPGKFPNGRLVKLL